MLVKTSSSEEAGCYGLKKCLSYLQCSINNTKLRSSKWPQSGTVLYPAGGTYCQALNEVNMSF